MTGAPTYPFGFLASVAAVASAHAATVAEAATPRSCGFCARSQGSSNCSCTAECGSLECWQVPGAQTRDMPGRLHEHYPVPTFAIHV